MNFVWFYEVKEPGGELAVGGPERQPITELVAERLPEIGLEMEQK